MARALLDQATAPILLPVDHVVADRFDETANTKLSESVPEGWVGLDIGFIPFGDQAVPAGSEKHEDVNAGG